MAFPLHEIISPVLSYLSDVYNFLLSSDEPAIRFLSLSAGLAAYVYFVWYFYHKVSCRDMAGFISQSKDKGIIGGIMNIFSRFVYIIKYLIMFPLYAFLWFFFIAMAMSLLNPGQDYSTLFMISAVIISTTRILAYVKEDAAMEITKLLPLVFISTVLLDTELLFAPVDFEKMFIAVIPLSITYFMIIIPLEIVLRILYDIKKIVMFGSLVSPRDIGEKENNKKKGKCGMD
jgi:hypothetical protein